MAHELSFLNGKYGMAYVGETPWHGLGQQLTVGAPIEVWQEEAGLNWEALLAPVYFNAGAMGEQSADGHNVLYRSDTGESLSVMGDRYKPVQPGEILEFYRELVEKHGFYLETAGSLKGGRKIWALANTGESFTLRGADRVESRILLATSFDGTMATQARKTSVRVVCNNTLSYAVSEGKADVTVRHSTAFDADKVKLSLGIGTSWKEFQEQAAAMAMRKVTQEDSVRFLLDVYHDIKSDAEILEAEKDPLKEKQMKKTIIRLQEALFNSPGAHMESARGMLWGLVNAVTYDVDYTKPARSPENRLNSAWFGSGDALKNKAMEKALAML